MGNNVLILIPCCKTKQPGGITKNQSESSLLDYLTKPKMERLSNLRNELANYFFEIDHAEYMQAYKRYSGAIYRRVLPETWGKLSENCKLDLVIISAFYGLLRYDDWICDYNITMKDKIGKKTLKTWWRNNGLCQISEDYIIENNISEVHNFLSNDYNEALKECCRGHIYFDDYAKYKSGSNAHRGEDVNKFIQDICNHL